MRVLHVMEATIGGTRRHLVDAARGLAGAGIEVHLCVAAERQPDFRTDLAALAAEGVGVRELPMVRAIRPATDARHLSALARELERVRPDVVHTHCSKAGVLGRLASVATGIGARVHTPHTFAFLFGAMFGPTKRALFRALEQHLAGLSAAVVAVSPTEARTIAASGVVPTDRLRVVENGVDPAPWRAAPPLEIAALGLDPTAPTAAVVGRVDVDKGQDLLVAALEEPGCEGLQLLVAGDGPLAAPLAARARERGLDRRVRWLGWRTDVPRVLAAADLVVLPSRWEGMPYIALEAMASARPIVATPVDGALDLVAPGETGFLAERIDAVALGAALARLLALAPAERRTLGERGRERVLARYTLERMIAGLVALYEEVTP